MSIKRWYKIELDQSGAILSCNEVDAAERNGKLVRYVEAIGKAEACDEVKRWYAEWLTKRRAVDVQRRASLSEAGMCPGRSLGCLKKPEPGVKHCRVCLAAFKACRRDRDSRLEAGDTRDLRLHPNGAAGVKEAVATRHRRSKIKDGGLLARGLALRQFDALGPVAFRAWLVAEIERYQREHSEPEAQAAE